MKGQIIAVSGNMVIAEAHGRIVKNSVGYCNRLDGARLLCEVIRIRGNLADLQVFEETRGLRVGDTVDFAETMLSVTLGPGLLGQIYDGLQKPLPQLVQKTGYFLDAGTAVPALDARRKWAWTPAVAPGEAVFAGTPLGSVPESIFDHAIMVPFSLNGEFTVETVAREGEYTIDERIATLIDPDGQPIWGAFPFRGNAKTASGCRQKDC